MTDASSKIDIPRLKVGDLLTKYYYMSSIPCSWSVVISVPVMRQRRHLERIQSV